MHSCSGIMLFEWDEDKREATRRERGLDFADAPLFFDGRPIIVLPSPRETEERWRTTAKIEGAYYTRVWVWREGAIRVISMRRAHDDEKRAHRALHG
jgi:uncharacterized DUF497 family protein